jgi:Immunity protein Imm1
MSEIPVSDGVFNLIYSDGADLRDLTGNTYTTIQLLRQLSQHYPVTGKMWTLFPDFDSGPLPSLTIGLRGERAILYWNESGKRYSPVCGRLESPAPGVMVCYRQVGYLYVTNSQEEMTVDQALVLTEEFLETRNRPAEVDWIPRLQQGRRR